MDYIADLHTHSPYSRATSPEGTLSGLAGWARVKGIHVIGTGDFTHPGWFRCLREELTPSEPGLFRLKDEEAIASPLSTLVSAALHGRGSPFQLPVTLNAPAPTLNSASIPL